MISATSNYRDHAVFVPRKKFAYALLALSIKPTQN